MRDDSLATQHLCRFKRRSWVGLGCPAPHWRSQGDGAFSRSRLRLGRTIRQENPSEAESPGERAGVLARINIVMSKVLFFEALRRPAKGCVPRFRPAHRVYVAFSLCSPGMLGLRPRSPFPAGEFIRRASQQSSPSKAVVAPYTPTENDLTPALYPAGTGIRPLSNAPDERPSSSKFCVQRAA